MEGFEAAVSKPAVKSGGNGANGILQEGKTFTQRFRIESCSAHKDVLSVMSFYLRLRIRQKGRGTAYRMPIDVLCYRMYDDVRAMIQRILDVRAQEGIVNHNHDTMLMRYRSDLAYVDQAQGRITRTFDPYQLRLTRPYEIRDVHLDARRECNLNAMRRSDLSEVSMRTTIYVGYGDDVRSGGEGLEDSCSGRRSGGKSEGEARVFEGCDGFFEVLPKHNQ